MKIAFVTSFVSRRAGGLFFSVRPLAQTLAASGASEVQVLGIEDRYTQDDLPAWGTVEPKTFKRFGPSAFGYAPGLGATLSQFDGDLVHTQGLWMYPSVAVQRWAVKSGRSYLVTPRGMLDSWAIKHSGRKKRLAGRLYENAHLHGAACLHALCEAEAEAIRGYGLRNPICVIPNGIDLPEERAVERPPVWAHQLPANARVLFYLGRLHPKKGLPLLLGAWSQARTLAEQAGWHLVIAGWEQNDHQARLMAQLAREGLSHQVHLVGPQFGEDKEASYRRADAFVLPS